MGFYTETNRACEALARAALEKYERAERIRRQIREEMRDALKTAEPVKSRAPRSRALREEHAKKAKELIDRKYSHVEAAQVLGITHGMVASDLREFGLLESYAMRPLSEEEKRRYVEMRDDGMSMKKIAYEMGINSSRLYRMVAMTFPPKERPVAQKKKQPVDLASLKVDLAKVPVGLVAVSD